MNNGRDCPHGRQGGKCDTCDLIKTELELEKATAERDALAISNNKLRDALDKVANWNECSLDFRVSYGSNGERDFYRSVAKNALSESRQHHIAAHDAEVAENAVNDFCEWMLLSKRYSVAEWCGEYTEQLRTKTK